MNLLPDIWPVVRMILVMIGMVSLGILLGFGVELLEKRWGKRR